MGIECWFKGSLEFENSESITAARKSLTEEGYDSSEENMFREDENLVWNGNTVSVDLRGSMPHDCFETSSMVLDIYAFHAKSGKIITVNLEDGIGEELKGKNGKASQEDWGKDELSDEEIKAVRLEYGWTE